MRVPDVDAFPPMPTDLTPECPLPEAPRPPVLLVGATGRVGRMVCHHWPSVAGNTPLWTTARRSVGSQGAKATFLWDPLEGPQALLDHLARPDIGPLPVALVMLAGVTPGPGVVDAALSANRTLALSCLAAAQEAGIGRVLIASSSAVYGVNRDGTAFTEQSALYPVSAYGRAKQDMEAALEPAREAGLQVCALRIGNVAGADALLGPLTGRAVDPTRPLRIDAFEDGLGPLRSYIGPADLARVLAGLAHAPAPLPAVLNIAAPMPVRMSALAAAAGWPYALTPAPATAVQSITLDCGLLQRLCPLSPEATRPETMVQQWKAGWC